MQLWKKNFFFVVVLFQGMLFAGLFAFVSYSFQQSLIKETALFKQWMEESEFLISKLAEEPTSGFTQELVQVINEQQQFYFKISNQDGILFSSIPKYVSLEEMQEIERFSIKKRSRKTYLFYCTSKRIEGTEFEVLFVKDSSFLYLEQRERIIYSSLFGVLFSIFLSVIIYWQMKKIYKPVQNLSHELRTPLTLISGYSEYLMRMKTTEEEKMTMSQEIFQESQQLQEVIEQLLIMGDLTDGELKMEKLYVSELIQNLTHKYPKLKLSIFEEVEVWGNRVLLLRLFDNLLDNAFRAAGDTEVQLIISGKKIELSNSGARISERQLRKMNRGKKLSSSEYGGSGQGFLICREIVLLHHGKITIQSDERRTNVFIVF
ncbi:HAMP domain-containing histidine kinase [Enterococcus sp. BWM-S5]|uniref:histidine kinase n=1 Tax=Enterococcus larvae TaxID=2794352 RepID=A0ABS4CI71_9ENTE|nr:HAMP domain-containing sensor histidine kinase [Enterococcus larvae]MBP1046130.1 HAMP domain-containing histidine kinase [Enterococcus larvae]